MNYIILCDDPQDQVKEPWRTKAQAYNHEYNNWAACVADIDLLNTDTVHMALDNVLHYSLGVAPDATD